ncbi:MAG: SGNH/GDSL hydrolase family protein [Kiritimatiellae bacterium]|nr:SGNH/GDSL hydrolase family protein [Kiritimatiellia bacterium]
MRYGKSVAVLICGLVLAAGGVWREAAAQQAAAQQAEEKTPLEKKWNGMVHEKLKKHRAMGFPDYDAALPNVLLIGDSISMQYTLKVRKLLVGKANVFRVPANGGPVARGLANFDKWVKKLGLEWAVIHFNFGLHDTKYENWKRETGKKYSNVERYAKELEEFVQKLKADVPNAKLIWASTTPVPEGAPANDKGDEVVFNEAAARIMATYGVAINDLYAAVLPEHAKYSSTPTNIHFNQAGADLLGEKVAAAIEKALGAGP